MTGLEALNILARNVESLEIDTFYECKGAYQFLEKSLKALEIIKEKNVAVAMLKSCGTVERYNTIAFDEECFKDKDYARKLTKDEFELLKEVLE